MNPCAECADRLLDYVYDLLDEAETLSVQKHLDDCPHCREELQQIRNHQRLLSNAAAMYRSVKMFELPTVEMSDSTIIDDRPVQVPAAIPIAAAKVERPIVRRRLWPWLATAAALLLLLAGGYGWYHNGLLERQAAVAAARNQTISIDSQLASFVKQGRSKLDALPAEMQANHTVLRAVGAAAYHPAIENHITLSSRDLADRASPSTATVNVINRADNKVLFTQKAILARGEAQVTIPPQLPMDPQAGLVLEVKPDTNRDAAFTQSWKVAAPSYLTHITLNKPVYRVHDTLRFRTLTLDRFLLTPPKSNIALRYSITDARGQTKKELTGTMGNDGISDGQFIITDDLPDGDYYFTVELAHPAESTVMVLPKQQAHFQIKRANAPEVALDRLEYLPGQVVYGNFRAPRLDNGAVQPNQPVTVTLHLPQDGDVGKKARSDNDRPRTLPTVQTYTDFFGNAEFSIPLPQGIPEGEARLEVQLHDGLKDEKIEQRIPLHSPQWTIGCFPEGGSLIASTMNRIYCRVSAPAEPSSSVHAELVANDGAVIERIALHRRHAYVAGIHFTTSFEFKPQIGQTYTLRVRDGERMIATKELPPAQADGIAMQVHTPVAPEGTPIELTVASANRTAPVLLLASCRGQVVDQQIVEAVPHGRKSILRPIPLTRGVVRLTAFEITPQRLVPRAERLVFRSPKENLDLKCETITPNLTSTSDQHVSMKVRAATEQGGRATPWVHASVVDCNSILAVPERAQVNLPAFAYLWTGDGLAGRLDEMEYLLARSTKETAQELDAFLAIEGWRRFVTVDTSEAPQLAAKDLFRRQVTQQPSVFITDNSHQVLAKFRSAVNNERQALAAQLQKQTRQLQESKEEAMENLETARAALDDWRALPWKWLRLALGMAAVALLVAGVLGLLLGLFRVVLRRVQPGSALVVGCIAAAASLLFYVAGTNLPVPDRGADIGSATPVAEAKVSAVVEFFLAQLALEDAMKTPKDEARAEQRSQYLGGVFLVNTKPAEAMRIASTKEASSATEVAQAQPRLVDMFWISSSFENSVNEQQQERLVEENLLRRFGASPTVPDPAASKSKDRFLFGGGRGGGRGGFGGQNEAGKGSGDAPQQESLPGFGSALTYREFPNYQQTRGQYSPGTVLWQPALKLADGEAKLDLSLPNLPRTYRILLIGNDAQGRLGFHEQLFRINPSVPSPSLR